MQAITHPEVITTKQLASLMGIRVRRLQRIVKALRIPHTVRNRTFYFRLDGKGFPDFFESVQRSLRNPNLKPFYLTSELARAIGRDRKTVIQMLIENDVRTYRLGTRRLILLVDLEKMRGSARHLRESTR